MSKSVAILRDDFKPGIYRHFKGNEYELLYLAKHSETREDMVVYRALYGERGIWVRPAAMWNEVVARDGERVKRFSYVRGGYRVTAKQRIAWA